jgi:hypothetical protein
MTIRTGYMDNKEIIEDMENSPIKISLDASSICQLKCPICPTSKGEIKNTIIGSGFLRLNDFKRQNITENYKRCN